MSDSFETFLGKPTNSLACTEMGQTVMWAHVVTGPTQMQLLHRGPGERHTSGLWRTAHFWLESLKGALGEDPRRKLYSDEGNRGDVGGALNLGSRKLACNTTVPLTGSVNLVSLAHSLSSSHSLRKMLISVSSRNGRSAM